MNATPFSSVIFFAITWTDTSILQDKTPLLSYHVFRTNTTCRDTQGPSNR